MADIDAGFLISLVQARPVLWDKFLDIYKDRNATNNAWQEVCVQLHSEYGALDNKDKIVFRKRVVRKWTYLRDSFTKFSKDKVSQKSGPATKKLKKYLHFDQMQFLHKFYDEQQTLNSLESYNKQGNEEDMELQRQASGSVSDDSTSLVKNSTYTPKGETYKEPDEIDLNISKTLEGEKPCSNITFLQSLLPRLLILDDQQFLQIQTRFLKTIKDVKENKEEIDVQPSSNCSHSHSQPQPLFVNPSNSTPYDSQLQLNLNIMFN